VKDCIIKNYKNIEKVSKKGIINSLKIMILSIEFYQALIKLTFTLTSWLIRKTFILKLKYFSIY